MEINHTPEIPAGMVKVSEKEFFEALQADPRDIMPSVMNPMFTTWETKDRKVWGWATPGWKNHWRGVAKTFAVFPAALEKIGRER